MTAKPATAKFDSKKYAKLLAQALPKCIESEEENEHYLQIVETIMKKAKLTAEEGMLLNLLAALIEEFESAAYPIAESFESGLQLLRNLMKEHELDQAGLAKILGSRSRATEVLTGKRGISRAMAAKLGEHFQLDPRAFLDVKAAK